MIQGYDGKIPTLKRNQPRHNSPNPPPSRPRSHTEQNRQKRYGPEPNSDLIKIPRTCPFCTECSVFPVAPVFDTQGEFAAFTGAIDHLALACGTVDVTIDGLAYLA
jgi:hypothetical protein